MLCTKAYREHIMYTFNGYCKISYALRLLPHGVTGAGGGKEKYPLNTSQKKKPPDAASLSLGC